MQCGGNRGGHWHPLTDLRSWPKAEPKWVLNFEPGSSEFGQKQPFEQTSICAKCNIFVRLITCLKTSSQLTWTEAKKLFQNISETEDAYDETEEVETLAIKLIEITQGFAPEYA